MWLSPLFTIWHNYCHFFYLFLFGKKIFSLFRWMHSTCTGLIKKYKCTWYVLDHLYSFFSFDSCLSSLWKNRKLFYFSIKQFFSAGFVWIDCWLWKETTHQGKHTTKNNNISTKNILWNSWSSSFYYLFFWYCIA